MIGYRKISPDVNDGFPYIDLREYQHEYSSGDGTEADPYVVRTEHDLFEVSNHLDKHFILDNDIELIRYWLPINYFSGVIDGNGFEISELNFPFGSGLSNFGLFDRIHGSVSNLGVTIKGDGRFDRNDSSGSIGGLASRTENNASISNCYVKGKFTGESSIGGLVGLNYGSISYCYAEVLISGNSNIGGLVSMNIGNISHSYAKTTISADRNAGGLVSNNFGNISYSYAKSTISANEYAGGLVSNNYANISYSYAESAVSASRYAGGLVSDNYSNISYSYAKSTVSANGYAGGLVGCDYTTAPAGISYSYAQSTVSVQNDYAGGLIGASSNSILTNCYARGSVSGRAYIGGLIGVFSRGSINSSYAACTITTHDNKFFGGLTGYRDNPAIVTNSYYDLEVSGCADTGKGTPLTTFEMKRELSLTGFDFNTIWTIDPLINNGYAYLQGLEPTVDESIGVIQVTIPDADIYKNYTARFTAPEFESNIYVADEIITIVGLDRTKIYRFELLSPVGVVFGTIENIDLSENRVVNITLNSLPQPKTVKVNLFGDNSAIYSGFTVSWYEGAKLLADSSSVSGLRSGMQLSYDITLDNTLSGIYAKPESKIITVSENDNANILTVNLASLQSQLTKITGYVKAGDEAIAGATVTLSSRPGLEPPYMITVITDENGYFEADVYPWDYTVDVVKFGYIDRQKFMRWKDDVTDGAIPNIELEKAEGLFVTFILEYTRASVPEETPITSRLFNTNNIRFKVGNITQNKEIENVALSGMSLVLPTDTVQADDEIRITAIDTTGNMLNAECSFIAKNHSAGVTLSFVQYGYWQARAFNSSSPNGVMALVYDSAGKYIATHTPNGLSITGDPLPTGQYTVVFIGYSQLLRNIADISAFSVLGLTENTDYVKKSVTITTGTITVISGLVIPVLDETKLYYTDLSRTSLIASKTEVVAGTLVTMRAEYAFLPKYAYEVSGCTLVIRIPIDCEFLANSVTVDGKASEYTRTATGFEVRTPNTGSIVRFCVVPKAMGNHVFNAFIRFDYQNDTLIQPVGTAVVKEETLKIIVPKATSLKTITARGIAEPNGTVKVYCNGNEAGTAKANAVGSWQLKFDLLEPSTYSLHDVYAEMKTSFGVVIRSETTRILYDAAYTQVTKITMINNNASFNRQMVFNFINPASIPFYRYYESYPIFTFIVELNEPDLTSNDVSVYVVTKNPSGEYTKVRTAYDSTKKAWIGSHSFDIHNVINAVGAMIDRNERKVVIDAELLDAIYNISSKPDPDELDFDYPDPNFDEAAFLERTKNMTDEEVLAEILAGFDQLERRINDFEDSINDLYAKWEKEALESGALITSGDCSGYDESKVIADGFIAYLVSDGSNIYVKMTEDSIVMLDFKRNQSQAIKFENSLNAFAGYMMSTGSVIDEENALRAVLEKINKLSNFVSFAFTGFDISITNEINIAESQLQDLKDLYRDVLSKMNSKNWLEMQILRERKNYLFSKITDKIIFIVNLKAIQYTLKKVSNTISLITDIAWTWEYFNKLTDARNNYENCCPQTCTGCDSYGDCKGIYLLTLSAYGLYANSQLYFSLSAIYYALKTAPAGPTKSLLVLIGSYAAKVTTRELVTKMIDFNILSINKIVDRCRKKCRGEEDEEEDNDDAKNKQVPAESSITFQPTNFMIDPSGYIYEAVPSNRLTGATVTAYSKADGLWNAEDYDQENPLITDWEGRYAWDVPMGDWQVRAIKTGYGPVESEWLPVPPPQTEVNLAMVSEAAPSVDYVSGFDSYIEIAFDKYMQPDTLTMESVSLCGYQGEYEIVWVNAEDNLDEPAKTFVRTIRILPKSGVFLIGETLGVSVYTTAKSYADVALVNAYHVDLIISPEPKSLEITGQINMNYGETRTITATVLPTGAGINRKITAVSNSPYNVTVDEEAMTNANGTATFQVKGELSGATNISFTLSGTQVIGTSYVTVALPGEPAQSRITHHTITAIVEAGGTVRIDKSPTARGETVTVTLVPYNGYELDYISATDESGATVNLYGNGNIRVFTMPDSAVTITSSFKAAAIPVTGVTLTPTSASIAVNSTLQLTATVTPPNATNRDLIWDSSNTAIVSVDTNGLVTAISAGVATITVTTEDGNKTANCLITVRIPVVSIQVTPSTLTLKEGSQDTVRVVFTPPNATNQTISWSTSNSTVATVSNGVISAHTEGTATITATAQGGKTAFCIVTVMRATNPKQEYYERKYPGKLVIILPEGGALGEAEGNTVIVGSEQNDDLIEFSNGGNIFVYEQNGGHDLITSVNVDEDDRNELHFGPGITSADLTFFKEDNDLYISIADVTGKESGSITIVDWYLAEQYKLAIVFDDDSKLTTAEIEALAIKPDNKLINVTPSAVVEKLTGNKNNLTITIVEKYADGRIVKIERTFLIDNNSAGIYDVGSYRVFVDTKGNTQIRSCYIVN